MEKKAIRGIMITLFLTLTLSTVLVTPAEGAHPFEDVLKNDLLGIANSVDQIERVYIDYWLFWDVCLVKIEYAPGLSDYEKVDLQYYVQHQLESKWYIEYVQPNYIYCFFWVDGEECPPWPGFVIGELLVGVKSMIHAEININPDTLNLKSKGKWITAYVELPEGYNVGDVDVSTILLNDVVPAIGSKVSGKKLMVRFDRSNVIALLSQAGEIELTVTGRLFDGTLFEGSDTIRVR